MIVASSARTLASPSLCWKIASCKNEFFADIDVALRNAKPATINVLYVNKHAASNYILPQHLNASCVEFLAGKATHSAHKARPSLAAVVLREFGWLQLKKHC